MGIAIVGTTFSNCLIKNLESASISPDYVIAVKQSATIVNQLPEEIRKTIIIIYVNSLRVAFFSIIPMSILCFISSLLMGNHKPKIRTFEETIVIEHMA